MSTWTDQMDRLLVLGNQTFGKSTSYVRPGFSPFTITGVPEFLDRLENVNAGQFYSIFYRVVDFEEAPFSASVTVTFTGPPNSNGTLTFDGIPYTSASVLDNSVPNQFLRGSSPGGAASNLANCINADPSVSGIFFSSSTVAHPTCSATWSINSDGSASVVVSALAPGLTADSMVAVDQMSFASLDSKQFVGGGPLMNDLVTVLGTIFRISDVPQPDSEGGIQIRLEVKK